MKGNAGQLSFRQQGGMTIVSGRIYNNKSAGDGSSLAQRNQRIRLAGVVNLYKAISLFEKKAWEGKPANVSDYNMFVKKNLSAGNVYFTKEEASLGAAYPMRCLVAQGSLSPITLTWITEDITTDLNLGEFVIDGEATVGELSAAIIANNYGYKQGDKITFGLCRVVWLQVGTTRFPSVQTEYIELTLDTASEALCSEVCASANAEFKSADGKLSITAEGHGAMIVHTREESNRLLCSTQMMVLQVRSGSAEPYSSDEAKQAAADSYGYQPAVLIQPGEYAAGGDTPEPTPSKVTLSVRLDITGTPTGTNNITIRKDDGSGELIATIPASAEPTDVEVDRGQVLYMQMNSDDGAVAMEWKVNGETTAQSVDVLTYTATANATILMMAAIV